MRALSDVHSIRLRKLGRRLRRLRKAAGMTAVAFATSLSLNRNYWGRVERGQQNVTFTMLSSFADALKVDIGTLLRDLDGDPLD